MNIVLINVSWKSSSDGSRLISAILKRAGHSVKSIFLARKASYDFDEEELLQMHELINDADLVLIGVYSNFSFRAVEVTEFIRKHYPGLKIIWGGPHCISAPEISLPYADGICFSEGDLVIADLVKKIENGEDYTTTPNMAFNVNGKHIINEVIPLTKELDSLPYPDLDLEDQFLLKGQLIPITKKLLWKGFSTYPLNIPTYLCLTSRGCPHNCSYCNNCIYTKMHGRSTLRFRSVDNFLGEIEHAIKQFGPPDLIGFSDDDFMARPIKQLEEFSEKYKKKIGLPFFITLSANTYNEKKMDVLLDSGLYAVQMGVQSGSQRVLDEVFQREIPASKTKEVVRKLEQLHKKHGIKLILDFIIDNPYETPDDVIKTYHYLVGLSRHTIINIFVLSFFPGTPIYKRALKDGHIETFSKDTFRNYGKRKILYQQNYETFLVIMINVLHLSRLRKYVPRFFLHSLGSKSVRQIAKILPEKLYAVLIWKAVLAYKRRIRQKKVKNKKIKINLSH